MATPTVRLVAAIPPDLHESIAEIAEARGTTRTSEIIAALRTHVAQYVTKTSKSGGKTA